MIIYLKGADFSAKNIGTLSTWMISKSLGSGTIYSGPSFVNRDPVSRLDATVTIEEGYGLNGAPVVKMGGVIIDAATVDGNKIIIAIAAVTGPVVITVATKAIGSKKLDIPTITLANGRITGDSVTNATTYELFKKVNSAYTSLKTEGVLNFDLDALDLDPDTYILVVKAKADGYEDSDYSNEVVYYTGDIDYPTETTWYVQGAHTGLDSTLATTNTSNGWVYLDSTEQEAIRNKPINALQIATTSTSGTVYVAIADSKGATSVHDLTKGTFTKTGIGKEVVTVLLEKTLVLTDNQYLVFEPSTGPTRDYIFYYGAPASGSGAKPGFISRVPTTVESDKVAWNDTYTGPSAIGISTGYVPQ